MPFRRMTYNQGPVAQALQAQRVGVVRDPDITAGIGQWSVIQAVAPLMGLEPRPINVRLGSDVQSLPRAGSCRTVAPKTAGGRRNAERRCREVAQLIPDQARVLLSRAVRSFAENVLDEVPKCALREITYGAWDRAVIGIESRTIGHHGQAQLGREVFGPSSRKNPQPRHPSQK